MSEILEIEIKSWCTDHEDVKSRLESEGACFSGTQDEVDIYFNHPERNFAVTDEALRIRSVNGNCRLTYKGPKVSKLTKARIEHETGVDSFEALKNIILSLGFTVSGSVEKRRSIYILNDVEICLDSVEGLGNFVEIEKKGMAGHGIEEELFEIAARLGLSSFERRSYLELKYFS